MQRKNNLCIIFKICLIFCCYQDRIKLTHYVRDLLQLLVRFFQDKRLVCNSLTVFLYIENNENYYIKQRE